MAAMRHHDVSFTIALTCISRTLILRDCVLGWVGPGLRETPGLSIQRLTIASGANLLDAIFVEPTTSSARAALLLCHGIGETVEHWFPVQQLFAANGVSTLLFDYSGYGRSTGRPSAAQYDLDALSAFHEMRRLTEPLYCTAIVVPMGVELLPIEIVTGTAPPGVTPAGIVTFT